MKKILGALFAFALCIAMFSFAASAVDTDLTWSLGSFKNSKLSTASTTFINGNTLYVTINLDKNPGMAVQKYDLIFDPAVLTFVPPDATNVYSYFTGESYDSGNVDENGDPIMITPEFGSKSFGNATVFAKPGDTVDGATDTNFIRWIGATDTNSTVTGIFMRLKFKVNAGLGAIPTTLRLEVDPTNTNAAAPTVGADPIILTSNTPTLTLNLNGYVAPVPHTLSFDANTTDPVSNMPTATTVNSSVVFDLTKVPLPERSGYTCLGWSTDKTNVVSSVTMPNADLTVYAIWQVKAPSTYTLNFDKNTTDNVTSMPADQTLNANTEFDLSTLTKPERFGYDFINWSTDKTEANIVTKITLTDANKTLYAIWKLKEVSQETQAPTSTRVGKKEIRDMFGNLIRTEDIPMLPHFGTQRAKQVSQGSTATSPTTTVRLIMGINSLEYTKAGFIVAAQGDLNKTDYNAATDKNTVLVNESTAYTSITADGQTYTAADFGAKYLIAIEIKDFPLAAYGNDMRVQGFVIGMDGTYHYDTASVIKVSDLFAK